MEFGVLVKPLKAGNKMDGQAFAMDYQPVADIYSTGVHEIASARSTRDPSSNIALFTCSYGGFDESDRATSGGARASTASSTTRRPLSSRIFLALIWRVCPTTSTTMRLPS